MVVDKNGKEINVGDSVRVYQDIIYIAKVSVINENDTTLNLEGHWVEIKKKGTQEKESVRSNILEVLENKNKKEYLFENIENYERIVEFEVNEAFKIGWDMARLKWGTIEKIIKRQ